MPWDSAGARRPQPKRRRWPWAIALSLTALVVIAAIAAPFIGRWYLLRRAIPKVAKRLGIEIYIASTRVSYGSIKLQGLRVIDVSRRQAPPLLTIEAVDAAFSTLSLLGGRARIDEVSLRGPHVNLVLDAQGNSLSRLLAERRQGVSGADRSARRYKLGRVRIEGGVLTARDQLRGALLKVANFDGTLSPTRRYRGSFTGVSISLRQLRKPVTFERLTVDAPDKQTATIVLGGGSLQLLPRLSLSAIGGTLSVDQRRRVDIRMAGSYGGATARLWSANGWVAPFERQGRVDVRTEKFLLGRIRSILHKTPVIMPDRSEVRGNLVIDVRPEGIGLRGGLAFRELNLFHPRVARDPVLGLSLKTRIEAFLRERGHELQLRVFEVSTGGVTATLSGSVQRLDKDPLIDLKLRIPPTDCQKLLDAIPPTLVPDLQGFKLSGTFEADLGANIDYAALDALSFLGKAEIEACRIKEAPEQMSAERLQDAFEHSVEVEPGQRVTIDMSLRNEDYVPYERISSNLIAALQTTEDAAFFRHRGYNTSSFKVALARNLQRGGFRLGASTISMQMVKNVLLNHDKTLSRKLEELFVVQYLERKLTKARILEIYLNAIEFGPAIYGVGRAAKHYFGHSAAEITPIEAAFFASILPSPKKRYVHYCRGKLSDKWDSYVRRILKRIHDRGRIDTASYELAKTQPLVFRRDLDQQSEAECIAAIEQLNEAWAEARTKRLRDRIMRAAPHQLSLFINDTPKKAAVDP